MMRSKLSFVALTLAALFVALLGTSCPPQTGSVIGDAAAGQALVNARCTSCHRAGGVTHVLDADHGEDVVSNLGTLDAAMSCLILTDQEMSDVKAFLATQ
jgi:mono/diheme cytochrome c family protein